MPNQSIPPEYSYSAEIIYNSAVGIVSTYGETSDLEAFLKSMKPHHINSFYGGSVCIRRLDAPITLYRTGVPGRFWTDCAPCSPWQQAFDLAMHPKLYTDYNMKLKPNWHPANEGVCVYQLNKGDICAIGPAAPQYQWPGTATQVFVTSVNKQCVQTFTWPEFEYQFKPSAPLRLSYSPPIAAMPQPEVPFAKPIKIWDVKKTFPLDYSPSSEIKTIPWRPGITFGSKVPMYQRLDWGKLGQFGIKIAAPIFAGIDYRHRLSEERLFHPEATSWGHHGSVIIDMAADNGSFIALAAATSMSFATTALLPFGLMVKIAPHVSNASPELLKNNRDVLETMLDCFEISPHVAKLLLEDFDKGGERSRRFTYNAVLATQQLYQPFEWIDDFKKQIGRSTGDFLSHLFKKEEPPLAFSSDSARKDPNYRDSPFEQYLASNREMKEDEPKKDTKPVSKDPMDVISLAEHLDKLFSDFTPSEMKSSKLEASPPIPNALAPEDITHGGISCIERTNDHLSFQLDLQSGILSTDVHHFLNSINAAQVKDDSLYVSIAPDISLEELMNVPPPTDQSPKKGDKAKEHVPFISNIALGPVGGSIGIIVTLANKGIISFTASKTGFFVSTTTHFGPGFFSAFGTAVGVGAVVAGVLMAAQHFYNKHLHHIQHKITASIKNSNKDIQFISAALQRFSQKLHNENQSDIAHLVEETKGLICLLNEKIKKENKRARYASEHKQSKARNLHHDVAWDHQQNIFDLFALKTALELDHVQQVFMETHQDKSSTEMIDLAKTLTSKTSFTAQDVANIKGLRQLIVNKVLSLATSGKMEEAKALLKETYHLQYYVPGNIGAMGFGEGLGKVDHKTSQDISNVNAEIKKINAEIAAGINPTQRIDVLINVICKEDKHDLGLRKNWLKRQDNRHEHSKKSSKYVSKDQWDKRIGLLDNLKITLDTLKKDYLDGNKASHLKLEHLSNLLGELATNVGKSAGFWIEELTALTQGKKTFSSEEEVSLFKAVASNQLLNHSVNMATAGEFEAATSTLQDLLVHLPELKSIAEQYKTKLAELKPFLKENALFWLGRLKSLHAIPDHEFSEAHQLELVLAKRFSLNGIFLYVAQGRFQDAKTILDNLKTISSEHSETADLLLAKISELESYYKDVPYCLSLLKKHCETISKEDKNLGTALAHTFANQVVMNDILTKLAEGKIEDANRACKAYSEASPEKSDKINEYQQGIETLTLLKNKPNDSLIAEYNLVRGITVETRTGKEEVIEATVYAWIIQNIHQAVSKGKAASAKADLNLLKTANPAEVSLYDRLIAVIDQGEQNAHQDEHFWQQAYVKLLKQKPSEQQDTPQEVNPDDVMVTNMEKTVALKGWLQIAMERSQLGFNREAAEVIKRMRASDPSLNLQEPEENFTFAHQGQVVSLFIKPIQGAILRYARGLEPSKKRTAALFGLELVNTAQIIVPNALVLAAQHVHIRCTKGQMCVFDRNLSNVLEELSKDINPFHKDFNPFNPKTSFNGAMIYSQLLLKGIQHAPLQRVVPVKFLYQAENLRNQALWLGNMTIQGVTTYNAYLQLLERGLFTSAHSPLSLAVLANAAVDFGYWGYHRYKESRGEAIESPEHYTTKEAVSTGFDVATVTWVAFLISNPGSWIPYAAFSLASSLGYMGVNSDSTEKESTAKALIATLNNVGYYRNLKALFHYIDECPIQVIQGKPNQELLKKAASREALLLAKIENRYVLYYAKDEKQGYQSKSLPIVESDLAPKSFDKIKFKLKANIISAPVLDEYTRRAAYIVGKEQPRKELIAQIEAGKSICFTQENNLFYIHFRDKQGRHAKVQLVEPPSCFDSLNPSDTWGKIDDPQEIMIVASLCVIEHYLISSRDQIKRLLTKTFGGLTYHSDQLEAANVARICHLYQEVKDQHDVKNYQGMIALLEKVEEQGKIVINPVYRIPPHLAWQMILFFRVISFVESKDLLLQFSDQYQQYSTYISDAAQQHEAWYHANWPTVQKSMESIVTYALQQLIVTASQATSKAEKLKYLSLVQKQYNYCKPWHVLLNDELKFWVASIYHELNLTKERDLFFKRIVDLLGLVKKKKQSSFTNHVLLLLSEADVEQHHQLLLQKQPEDFAILDNVIINTVLRFLALGQFREAKRIIKSDHSFKGKHLAKGMYIYQASQQTRILDALEELIKEESQGLEYWKCLYEILGRALQSTKYAPKPEFRFEASAKLYGFMKICADNIQSFEEINLELKRETTLIIEEAVDYISMYVKLMHHEDELSPEEVSNRVKNYLQEGHQCMRGEYPVSFLSQIERILTEMSYAFDNGETNENFLPLDVPADNDCAFHILGTSREAGIALLLKHVKSQNWVSQTFFGTTQRQDVLNILLDDLEIKNNTTYIRDEAHLKDNVQMVEAYLNSLAAPGTWIPYNQHGASVLDAMALLLKKNLRIFITNLEGGLVLTSSNLHDASFETIDVLCTSASGYSHDDLAFNHYIRLVKLSTNGVVEEINVSQNLEDGRPVSNLRNRFFPSAGKPDLSDKGKHSVLSSPKTA